jgi:hypothetical protein
LIFHLMDIHCWTPRKQSSKKRKRDLDDT